MEHLRVRVREVDPPLHGVRKLRPEGDHERQFATFLTVAVETVERVVVELPANITVTVQLLAVCVGQFEAILVGVVHQLYRWPSSYRFSTASSSEICPPRHEEKRIVPDRGGPQFGLRFVRVLVTGTASGRDNDRVNRSYEGYGVPCSEQVMDLVVSSSRGVSSIPWLSVNPVLTL